MCASAALKTSVETPDYRQSRNVFAHCGTAVPSNPYRPYQNKHSVIATQEDDLRLPHREPCSAVIGHSQVHLSTVLFGTATSMSQEPTPDSPPSMQCAETSSTGIPQFIAAGTHTQRVLSSPYHSAMRLSERSPQAFVKKNLIARRLIHTPHKNTCKKSVIPFLTYNMTLTRHTFSFPSECDVPYPPPLFLNPVSVPLTS